MNRGRNSLTKLREMVLTHGKTMEARWIVEMFEQWCDDRGLPHPFPKVTIQTVQKMRMRLGVTKFKREYD